VAPALSAPLRHDDFYVDATMRGWFRAWATGLAARVNTVTGVAYRDDPCIFAWELGNELACTNSSAAAPCVVNGSSPAMRAWVTEMSAAIKAVDGNHMVAVGDEGFYGAGDVDCPRAQWWCNGSAGDWLGLLRVPDVNFASLHVYPDSFEMGRWGIGSEDDVARGWIFNHTLQARAEGKPLLMGEFGHGAAGLAQHEKYANYTAAAAAAGCGGRCGCSQGSTTRISRTPAGPRGGEAATRSCKSIARSPATPRRQTTAARTTPIRARCWRQPLRSFDSHARAAPNMSHKSRGDKRQLCSTFKGCRLSPLDLWLKNMCS
jgi:hypothetical protein